MSGEALPERDENGVDLTLIRWMLSLTPAGRLDVLESFMNDILEIRELNGIKQLPRDPADACSS